MGSDTDLTAGQHRPVSAKYLEMSRRTGSPVSEAAADR
jgi:hypothetical protein